MWITTLLVLSLGSSFVDSSSSKVDSPYMFWRTTKLQLLPRTEHLITSVREAILTYFRAELVELPEDSEDALGTAERLCGELRPNITLVPSKQILDTEKYTRTPRFVKRLLKQNYARLHSFLRLMRKEKTFRCRIKDAMSRHVCTNVKDIETNIEALAKSLQHLLSGVLKTKNIKDSAVLKIERQLSFVMRNATGVDIQTIGEQDAQSHNRKRHRGYSKDAYYGDVDSLDRTYTRLYTERNKASVIVLFALFRHLQETVAELKYALKVL